MVVVPITMEEDGIDLHELENQLTKLPPVDLTPRRPFRAAAYVIATHQNPTGYTYSPGEFAHGQ